MIWKYSKLQNARLERPIQDTPTRTTSGLSAPKLFCRRLWVGGIDSVGDLDRCGSENMPPCCEFD